MSSMMSCVDFFTARIESLKTSNDTKAYLVGLFSNQALSCRAIDFSRQSLTTSFLEIRYSHNLVALQALADWVLWVDSVFPQHFVSYHEWAESIGRLCFYRCYKLVPSWVVYEDLADRLPLFARRLHHALQFGTEIA